MNTFQYNFQFCVVNKFIVIKSGELYCNQEISTPFCSGETAYPSLMEFDQKNGDKQNVICTLTNTWGLGQPWKAWSTKQIQTW